MDLKHDPSEVRLFQALVAEREDIFHETRRLSYNLPSDNEDFLLIYLLVKYS